LFGPNDNFDPNNSHLVAALIRKFHEAKINSKKEVILWGTGNPKREVLYVDDLANASVFLMQNYESSEAINIGTGKDRSIKNLAKIVKEIVGFEGEINFDISKSDGSMKKQLDTTKINSLGWEPKIETEEGIERTYGWFLEKIVDYNSL
jgi:GDP-L-fucose synthase